MALKEGRGLGKGGERLLVAAVIAVGMSGCTGAGLGTGRLAGELSSTQSSTRFLNRHILVSVAVDGSAEWLLLDTGFTSTVIDLQTAERADLTIEGRSTLRGVGPAARHGGVARSVSIRASGAEPYDIPILPVVDVSEVSAMLGEEFAGALGADFFGRFVVEIDYALQRVTLHDPRRYQPDADMVAIPLDLSNRTPHVRASVVLPGGRVVEGHFQIDVGSAAALTLATPFGRPLLTGLGRTISGISGGIGGETASRVGRLQAFELGPFTLDGVIAMIHTDTSGVLGSGRTDGLIGGEVLDRFTVTFDYSRSTMYLLPNDRLRDPFEANAAGFAVMAAGPQLQERRVFRVARGSAAERAGLREGDTVLEVDGRNAGSFPLHEWQEILRQHGHTLFLTVRRHDESIRLEIPLDRQV